MTNYTLLTDPQELLGRQWSQSSSPERLRTLGLARDALCFLGDTGQHHDFEDFHRSPASEPRPRASCGPEQLNERIAQAEAYFQELRDASASEEDQERIHVILDALRFITSSDQCGAFNEYLAYVEAGGPPYVMASFETREQAEDWLARRPRPPDLANILIAGNYHCVAYDRATGSRHLPRSHDLEYYLAGLKRDKPPLAIASFIHLGEAEAWWSSQPPSATWAWLSVAGEFYLAAYYPHIGCRALYPLSMAEGYEVEPG